MTDNIVEAVSRYLTPGVIGQLASVTGLDRNVAQRASAAVVPSILSGLVGLVTKPDGARQLTSAIGQQPTDLMDNIGKGVAALTPQLAEKGSGLLSSLLGGDLLGSLTPVLAKFVGVGDDTMRSLMGFLTPMIMGTLGRQQAAHGFDADGLARALTQQKQAVTDAMPAGLADILRAKGLSLGDTSGAAAPASPDNPVRREARPEAYASPRGTAAPHVARNGSQKSARWLYLVPLLALAAFAWYALDRAREPTPTAEAPQAGTATTYLAKAPAEWLLVRESPLIGLSVLNRAGESIGAVKEVLKRPDGSVAGIVVGVAQVLGIGEKDIAVPYSVIVTEQVVTGSRIVLDASKDRLQAAPAFQR